MNTRHTEYIVAETRTINISYKVAKKIRVMDRKKGEFIGSLYDLLIKNYELSDNNYFFEHNDNIIAYGFYGGLLELINVIIEDYGVIEDYGIIDNDYFSGVTVGELEKYYFWRYYKIIKGW